MGNEMYEVELIANPAVKRMMSGNSLRINASKWRLVGAAPAVQPPKKNEVAQAAVSKIEVQTAPKEEPKTESPFMKIEDAPKTEAEKMDSGLELLRGEYLTKFGKKPKGNWGVKRLSEEIAKPAEA